MSAEQSALLLEAAEYLTKDGASMELAHARKIARLLRKLAATPAQPTEVERDGARYRECLEWVKGYIGRYDPPGIPNHVVERINAALSTEGGENG